MTIVTIQHYDKLFLYQHSFAAETARIQGVDLYSEQAPRLAAALEFHTALLNAGGYPPTVNVTSPLVCNGTVLKLSTFPTYQAR